MPYPQNQNYRSGGYQGGGYQNGGYRKKDENLVPCPDFKLYSDPVNKVRERKLYEETAKEIAKSFKDITKTRLRRFFDEAKSIARKPGFSENYSSEEASIVLLKSKVSYMIGRETGNREENGLRNLKKFFDIGIAQVHDAQSYKDFVTLFEAVYGYFYEEARD